MLATVELEEALIAIGHACSHVGHAICRFDDKG
jgi:hypothetical protein